MTSIFFIISGVAMVGVVASLVLGVASMTKGGETSKKYSNKFMRARVGLQAVAVLFFILALATIGK